MSALLTWKVSPVDNSPKSAGTYELGLIQDIKNLVYAYDNDPEYHWQVASYELVNFPWYVVLKPKSGAVGRVLLVCYNASPGTFNTTLFDNCTYWNNDFHNNHMLYAYFPMGNVDIPSNLKSQGVVMGDDEGACAFGGGSSYDGWTMHFRWQEGSVRGLYFAANEEMIAFRRTNSPCILMFGNCWVDGNDKAYPGMVDACPGNYVPDSAGIYAPYFHTGNEYINTTEGNYCGFGGGPEWNRGRISSLSLYYGGKKNTRWQWQPEQNINTASSRHINTSTGQLWFRSRQIVRVYDQVNAGWTAIRPINPTLLKFRQMAANVTDRPNSFYEWYETGPTLIAKQFDHTSANATGPWLTQFKM